MFKSHADRLDSPSQIQGQAGVFRPTFRRLEIAISLCVVQENSHNPGALRMHLWTEGKKISSNSYSQLLTSYSQRLWSGRGAWFEARARLAQDNSNALAWRVISPRNCPRC